MKNIGIKERMQMVLDDKGSNPTQLSKAFKINQKTLNSQINGDTSVSASTIQLILSAFDDISAEWLITGNGEMYKTDFLENMDDPLDVELGKAEDRIVELETELSAVKSNKSGIPYYVDLPVSAGRLDVALQSAEPSGHLDIPGVRATALFPVVGCSMKPDINPGDVIGIMPVDSWDRIDPDKVYLVITSNDRMIKHLAPDETDDGMLWCISPNYPRFKISKDDIKFVYHVTYCGKLL